MGKHPLPPLRRDGGGAIWVHGEEMSRRGGWDVPEVHEHVAGDLGTRQRAWGWARETATVVSRYARPRQIEAKFMSVAILVQRGVQTVDSFPLSNQPFIQTYYIPTAERMGLDLLPLITRAAGLLVDSANKEQVIAELACMDQRVAEYLAGATMQSVLGVNTKIRQAILEHMTDENTSLYIG
jgi:hypothetical protein